MLKLGELCAGFGGLSLAVEHVFGAETAWVSEFEDAPSKILAHHWPNVPNHGDMTKIDWAAVEPVDIISGGTPCQDLSAAGKRAGMTEGTRSNLWVQMREAIAIIQPTYVVWENVRGAYSAGAYSEMEQSEGRVGEDGNPNLRAIGRVLGDLSDLGYDCQWRGLRAADVGAPHGRFRVFVLATRRAQAADADNAGSQGQRDSHGTTPTERHRHAQSGAGDTPADCDYERGNRRRERAIQNRRGQLADSGDTTSDADSRRFQIDQELNRNQAQDPAHGNTCRRHIDGHRLENDRATQTYWGPYERAIRRWESVLGRRAPAPTEPTGRNGGHRLSARFCEWMMGVPDGWIVDVPGITRNQALKAAGNGVVTQQAIAALRDMLAASERRVA